MSLLNMMPEERIDSWRQRVPSRIDREDPFEGDHFDERPPTRLVTPPPPPLSNILLNTNHISSDFSRCFSPRSSTFYAPGLLPRCNSAVWA
jgi:hypothetical protein